MLAATMGMADVSDSRTKAPPGTNTALAIRNLQLPIPHRINMGLLIPLANLKTPAPPPIPRPEPKPRPDPEPQPGSDPDVIPPLGPEPEPDSTPNVIPPKPQPEPIPM